MRFALFSLLLPLLLASPSSQIPAVTRGAFVSMLWEQAGGVPYDATPVFSDVDRDGPWATAVAWAAARGLILGNGSGRFEPERPITWEEAALILRRWQALYGRDVPLSVGHVAYRRFEGTSPWSAASLYRTAGRFASMLPQLSSCTPYKRPDRRGGTHKTALRLFSGNGVALAMPFRRFAASSFLASAFCFAPMDFRNCSSWLTTQAIVHLIYNTALSILPNDLDEIFQNNKFWGFLLTNFCTRTIM